VWGVKGFFYDKHVSTDHTIQDIKNFLKENELVHTNDYIINISSIPMSEKGKSNMIKLSIVD
jgi:pyruvate kinase